LTGTNVLVPMWLSLVVLSRKGLKIKDKNWHFLACMFIEKSIKFS